jgi:hypothetical protein
MSCAYERRPTTDCHTVDRAYTFDANADHTVLGFCWDAGLAEKIRPRWQISVFNAESERGGLCHLSLAQKYTPSLSAHQSFE